MADDGGTGGMDLSGAYFSPSLYQAQQEYNRRMQLAQTLLAKGAQGGDPRYRYSGLEAAGNMILGSMLMKRGMNLGGSSGGGIFGGGSSSPPPSQMPAQAPPQQATPNVGGGMSNIADTLSNAPAMSASGPSSLPATPPPAMSDGPKNPSPIAQEIWRNMPHIPGMDPDQQVGLFMGDRKGFMQMYEAKIMPELTPEKLASGQFGTFNKYQGFIGDPYGPRELKEVQPGGSLVDAYAAPPTQGPIAAPTGAAPPPTGLLPGSTAVGDYLKSAFPGIRITSGFRTPSHNAQLPGSSPTSLHMDDRAVDIVPPPGVTPDQLRASLAQQGLPISEFQVVTPQNAAPGEGSHIHIGWGQKGTPPIAPGQTAANTSPVDPRVVYRAPPQWRLMTRDEATNAGVNFGSQLNSATGEIKPLSSMSAASLLSDNATQMAASMFIKTGQLPSSMGRGGAPTITKIINAAAAMKPDDVSENDWGSHISDMVMAWKAKQGAVNVVAKQGAITSVNEGTVNNSINILTRLMPKAASTGQFTSANQLEQYLARQSNNPDAINLKNAIDSISAEYARVLTGSTTGAPASDAARAQAAERILIGYNQKALPQVLAQMQAEMRGRTASFGQVGSSLTNGAYQAPAVPFSQSPIIRYDKNGNRLP